MENNSKITDIKNLKYKLKREGYYWSDIYDHTNSKETFLSIHRIKQTLEHLYTYMKTKKLYS